MFIYILILIAIFFFISWNLGVNNKTLHYVSSLISTILLVLGILVVTMNFHDHAFMHHETTSKISRVDSISPNLNMVLNQYVGTSKKEQALIYKVDKKRVFIKPDTDVNNKVIQTTNVKKAELDTKTTRWKYNSSFSKLMFDAGQKQTVSHKVNTIYVPKDWLVITPKQAKQLPVIMKQLQSQLSSTSAQQQMATAGKAFVQQALMTEMKKNPKMSASQKAKVMKQAEAKFKAQAQAQAMKKMLPMLKSELAKTK